MSLTPEPAPQPNNQRSAESGASHGSASAITVICNREHLAQEVQHMLEQPLMRQAVRAAFPEPVVEGLPRVPTTLKLVQSRSPVPGVMMRGNVAIIEYSERVALKGVAPSHIQRELLKKAIIESAIVGLRHFSIHSSLPNGCREELRAFVQALTKRDGLTASEVRAVISDTIRSEHERLQRQKKTLLDKLKSSHLAAALQDDQINTAGVLVSTIMAISLLVDQPGVKSDRSDPSDRQHIQQRTKVVEQLERFVQELALGLVPLWTRAVFEGDIARADAISKLQEILPAKFKFAGFNGVLPELLSTGPAAPSRVRFSAESLGNTASYVSQAHATTQLEKQLRDWSTDDPQPPALLQENLLTLCQGVPLALRETRHKLPAELPVALQDFIKTLCLYRIHGGTEGAAYFASVACHQTHEESVSVRHLHHSLRDAIDRGDAKDTSSAKEALEMFLSKIPASHPEDYVSLVNFVAGWPLLSGATERDIALRKMFGRLSALATLVVDRATRTLEESFLHTMSDPRSFNADLLALLGHDVAGLAEAVRILDNPELSANISPITASLTNLIDVLKVETEEPRCQLQYFGRVKRAWQQQQELVASLPSISESRNSPGISSQPILARIKRVYDSLASRLPTYVSQLRQELVQLDESGEITRFVEKIADAVAVTRNLESPEISSELEMLIDSKVISVANTLGEALQCDQDTAIAGLDIIQRATATDIAFSRVSAVLSAGTFYTSQLDTLREIFRNSSFTKRDVRVNHIDGIKGNARKKVTAALLRHPDLLKDYAQVAARRLKDPSIRNPSMIESAKRFLALELDLRQPEFREVRQARATLQSVIDESEGDK